MEMWGVEFKNIALDPPCPPGDHPRDYMFSKPEGGRYGGEGIKRDGSVPSHL